MRNPKVWGSIPHEDSELFLCSHARDKSFLKQNIIWRRKQQYSFFENESIITTHKEDFNLNPDIYADLTKQW